MNPVLSTPPAPCRSRTRAPLLRRWAPFLLVVVFVVAVLYRLTVLGEALYWGDMFLYFYPLEDVVRASLRAGRIPLWNQYVLCGQPLVGNPQAWVFYPTTALLSVLPVWLYFTVNVALHLMLAGIGVYLYLRRLCRDRMGALLGAITYVGSGYIIGRLQFPPMAQSTAYLPWLLLLIDRIVDRPRILEAALLALVCGLTLLAAHTQIAYLTFACGTVYAAARLYQIRRHPARAWRAFAKVTAALLVGILVSSVQLLPSLQLLPLSPREHLTWSEVNRFILLPEQLVNFLFPYYFGSPAEGNYWGAGNIWEPCVYLGIVPLALAIYAALCAARRLAVRFFVLLCVVSLLLAMGRYGGLYWLAYNIVPGLASFHDPARFAFLTTFAFTALAAVGLRVLRDRGVSNRVRTGLVHFSAMNLWWFSAHFNPTLAPSIFRYRPVLPPVKAGAGRVFSLLHFDVWRRYVNYSDYGLRTVRYGHELADTLIPNIAMGYGVEEGNGYEPVPIRSVAEVIGLVQEALERQSPNLPMLLDLFNAHDLLLPHGTRYPHPQLQPTRAHGVTMLAARDPLPRAWLVRRTLRVDGAERSLAALAAPDFNPQRMAIVSRSAGLGATSELADPPPSRPVVTIAQYAGRFEADVDAGSAPAFLVWSATSYPGWRVSVDARPARLERADHAFLGVVVPPGRHRVLFEYRPFVIRFGFYLTLTALAVIASGLSGGLVVRSHRRRIRPGERGIHAATVNLTP